MKVQIWFLLIIHVSCLLGITNAVRSSIYAPLHLISLKDITADERRQIALLEQKLDRAKRSGHPGSGSSGSGSGDILNAIKNAIGNSIKKKVGQLAMASASASGAFSKTSSGGGDHHSHHEYYEHHPHPPPHHYESHSSHSSHSSFDFWDLKKSVLNTLLQAVKAIKGGVIAVKGQLIKGGGKLVSASGHLVSSQGDAITNLGKQIATSAILVPWMGSSGKGHPHAEYESDHHYTAPSAPEDIHYHHGPHSDHHEDYHVPEHYPPPHRADAAGLLVLKKVTNRGSHNHHQPDHYASPSDISPHQASPSFGTIIGKLLSASSSLDPHKPDLFGNRPPVEHDTHDSYQAYVIPNDKENEVIHAASGVVNHQVSTSNVPKVVHKKPTFVAPVKDDSIFEDPPEDLNENFDITSHHSHKVPVSHQNNAYLINSDNNDFNAHHKEPVSYQNSAYLIDSDNQDFNLDPRGQSSPTSFQSVANPFDVTLDEAKDLAPTSPYLSPPTKNQQIVTDFNQDEPEHDEMQAASDAKYTQITEDSGKSKPSPYLETPIVKYFLPTPSDLLPVKVKYAPMAFYKNPSKQSSSSSRSPSYKKHSSHKTSKHKHQNHDLVQSISYELGPNGPKRLT